MNNTAIVGQLQNITPIEKADKIVRAEVYVLGVSQAQVIVGKDCKNGDPVAYFTSNMCLTEEVLEKLPQYRTYLGRANRVKTITLRNTLSDGLVIPINEFSQFINPKMFVEGDEFLELNGHKICYRYTPPIKIFKEQGKKKDKKPEPSRLIDGQIRLHYDTQPLKRNLHKIDRNKIVSISRKMHGMSWGVHHCLVLKQLKWYERLLLKLGVNIVTTEYDYVYHSRESVRNGLLYPHINLKYPSKYNIFKDISDTFFKDKLYKGEAVYGEVVGFFPTGMHIQKNYPYGCVPNTYKIYIYRMTMTNVDGIEIEYSWDQMTERAKELGVDVVPLLYRGTLNEWILQHSDFTEESSMLEAKLLKTNTLTDNELLSLLEKVYLGKRADDCNGKPDEGVYLRYDHLYRSEGYKLKDPEFVLGESKAFEQGIPDPEEEQKVEDDMVE